jgi:hypothetical protein
MKTPKKLEAPEKNPNTKELFIEFSSICSRDYHSGERYGKWETINHPKFEKISRNKEFIKKWNFESFKVSDEVFNSQNLYIVWVEYSSGNSFGRSKGEYKVAAITEIPQEALNIRDSIVDNVFNTKHSKSVVLYARWDGYFESVTAVHIEFYPVLG